MIPKMYSEITIYFHGDEDHMREKGESLGLTGEALARFEKTGYEVTMNVWVDLATGEAHCYKINDTLLEKNVLI